MKANAPERIYAYIPDDDIVGSASIKKGIPHQFVTTEYIRTDAFIEKVVGWLKCCLDNGMWIANDVGVAEKEAIIDDFRRYLEE